MLVTVLAASLSVLGVAADAESAARSDGLRRVIDEVVESWVSGGGTVRSHLGFNVDNEMRLRDAVASCCRYLNSHVDRRGFRRVTACLDTDQLKNTLAGSPEDNELTAIVEKLCRSRFAAVGIVGGDGGITSCSHGWENVLPAGMKLAEKAAREDMMFRLRAKLRNWLGNIPNSENRISGLLDRVMVGEPQYLPGQVCVVMGRIELGGDVEPAVIESSGHGIPPVMHTVRADRLVSRIAAPEWANRTLVAYGQGTAGESGVETDSGRNEGVQAAVVDGTIQLAREIDRLSFEGVTGWTSNLSLKRFINFCRDDDDVWDAYIRSVRLVETGWDKDVCRVTLEIDLDRLWELVAARLEWWDVDDFSAFKADRGR